MPVKVAGRPFGIVMSFASMDGNRIIPDIAVLELTDAMGVQTGYLHGCNSPVFDWTPAMNQGRIKSGAGVKGDAYIVASRGDYYIEGGIMQLERYDVIFFCGQAWRLCRQYAGKLRRLANGDFSAKYVPQHGGTITLTGRSYNPASHVVSDVWIKESHNV